MIHSMTGYGKGSAVKNNFSADVEIKSVNSRFLELFLKLPPLLSDREYEMLEILKSKRITSILCPIQSGNDRILEQMQREHTIDDLREVFKAIQKINPDIKISTQIMTGFPSETEEEFLETLEFVKDIKFDYTVIFPYHEKEMTPSGALGNKVPEDIIQERFQKGLKYLRKNKLRVYTSCP